MKIAVLVSGGVDSSVALRLLQDEGHELTAFYLKIWLADELSFLGDCPWEDDLSYARAVCDQANIPLEVVPFQKEYWERVVGYTISEAKSGRTPNPDMLCNAQIKFGAFYEYIEKHYSVIFEKIATGHYAQTVEINGLTLLKTTPDAIKDQTYFLSQLSQKQITKAVFPIGNFEKDDVRKLAEKYNLANARRKDSQGICFLGKIPFDEFLEYHLGKKPGNLIEYETGKTLGQHNGFWYFTIGQRRGLKLSGGPWYVVAKNTEKNEVYISHAEHQELTRRSSFEVDHINWISGIKSENTNLMVKVRHGARMYSASVVYLNDHKLHVKLKDNDQGIASGQFAVFYNGQFCLGGGIIL